MSLESNWKRLLVDIRIGRISDDLQIDDEIREKLNSELTADPERAAELQVTISI